MHLPVARVFIYDLEAAQSVFAELFQIQSSCLTPEELEQMGIAPAGS